MRPLLYILLALALAVAVAVLAMEDPGYVLITRAPWSVELSLTLFLVLLAAGFLAGYLLVRLGLRAAGLPRAMAAWRRRRRREAARAGQGRGLIRLLEGRWLEAERLLLSRADDCDFPLLNYLGAAAAAQERGDLEARDRHLGRAHEAAPKEELATGLTQAALCLRQGQSEQALAILKRLEGGAPHNPRRLQLLAATYRELKDWRGLAELFRPLHRGRVLPPERLDALEREVCRRLLAGTGTPGGGGEALVKVWDKLVPARLKEAPEVLAAYARRLVELKAPDRAEAVLRKAIGRHWQAELVRLYGQVPATDPRAQLKQAEAWLPEHPYSPNLLLTLGRLALRNQIWGRARSYLESAAASGAGAEAYNELGHLLERLGEKDEALACYRKGLELAAAAVVASGPPIPGPAAPVPAQASGPSAA